MRSCVVSGRVEESRRLSCDAFCLCSLFRDGPECRTELPSTEMSLKGWRKEIGAISLPTQSGRHNGLELRLRGLVACIVFS